MIKYSPFLVFVAVINICIAYEIIFLNLDGSLPSTTAVPSQNTKAFRKELDEYWENYKKQYWEDYNEKEEEQRRTIWEDRYGSIEKHNSDNSSKYQLGINQYSHMPHDEFVKHYNGYQNRDMRKNNSYEKYTRDWKDPFDNDTDVPSSMDWREKGIITPVKNQKQCGSCWAFASTGVLEAYHLLLMKKNVTLSEQNLLDCSKEGKNKGCDGGSMDDAFAYIIDNGGLNSDTDYPYQKDDDFKCRFNLDKIAANCTGYVNLPKGDENALLKTVAEVGPVAVAIDASHESFQNYKGGIYEEPECKPDSIDHAVLVVGYGTEDDGTDYWLIKNSWGSTWGIDGYMKMVRNKDNHCGIATEANFPIL